jgi:hypothetical protein
LLQYPGNLLDNFVELVRFQMTYSIQDDAHINGKDAIWTNIALPLQTALCKVLIIELNGVLMSERLTSDLAKNSIIPLQFS